MEYFFTTKLLDDNEEVTWNCTSSQNYPSFPSLFRKLLVIYIHTNDHCMSTCRKIWLDTFVSMYITHEWIQPHRTLYHVVTLDMFPLFMPKEAVPKIIKFTCIMKFSYLAYWSLSSSHFTRIKNRSSNTIKNFTTCYILFFSVIPHFLCIFDSDSRKNALVYFSLRV